MCIYVHTRAFRGGAGRAQRRRGCEPASSCLPAVGPGQTVSSEPGFHHFTWKDLKAPRCCRASTAAARRRRKLPAIWKKEQGSHRLSLANISIPDTQSVSCAHPHWTDRETEAERDRARVSEKEQHEGRALGAFPRHLHTPPLPTLRGDPPSRKPAGPLSAASLSPANPVFQMVPSHRPHRRG